MFMIWCAMSRIFEHSGYPQVNLCMHHVLQWDQPTTPVKDAIEKTTCIMLCVSDRAHEVMRQGARAVFHRWISCFMILSGYKAWVRIRLHHVARMKSCASTNSPSNTRLYTVQRLNRILLYYSLFCHFVCSITSCVVFSVIIQIVCSKDHRHVLRIKKIMTWCATNH